MYQKIKAKFKANPTIFYACSIVASWAGVGSLMNFRTLAILRILWTTIYNDHNARIKEEQNHGKH